MFVLTGGVADGDGYRIAIALSLDDVDAIKLYDGLAESRASTFLSLGAGAIRDVNQFPSMLISVNSSLQVTTLIIDITPPVLTDFALDMNTGVLNLTFDEVVLVSSFDFTQFELVDAPNASIRLPLSNVTVPGVRSRAFSIALPMSLVNNIQRNIPGIAFNRNNTYIVVSGPGVTDLNGYAILAFPDSSALQASELIPDTNPPELVDFQLNLITSTITLVFDEIINPSSANLSFVSLQNAAENATEKYTLTDASSLLSRNPERTIEILVRLLHKHLTISYANLILDFLLF